VLEFVIVVILLNWSNLLMAVFKLGLTIG